MARDRARRGTQAPAKVDGLDAAVWEHVEVLLEDPAPRASWLDELARLSEAYHDDQAAVQRREAQLQRFDREEQWLVDANR